MRGADSRDAEVEVHDWRRLLGVMCLAGCFVCSLVLISVVHVLSIAATVAASWVRAVWLHMAAARAGLLACVLPRRGRR